MKLMFFVSVTYILGSFIHLASSFSNSGEIKFSILSSRNDSGYWNAQIQLEHGVNDGLPLEVDLGYTTTRKEKAESVLIITKITAPPAGPGYEFIPKHGYYKFHTNPKNWFEAYKICRNEGAHLAILNSEEESKALLTFWLLKPKFLEDWRYNYAFIGVHDNYKEGEYVTIFDVPLNATGFASWSEGEPNSGISANCLGIRRNVGTFSDENCNEELAFFCERELN